MKEEKNIKKSDSISVKIALITSMISLLEAIINLLTILIDK